MSSCKGFWDRTFCPRNFHSFIVRKRRGTLEDANRNFLCPLRRTIDNEEGSANILLVLFLTSTLLLQLTGGLTFLSLSRKVPTNDVHKLQAKYLAEAGVWLTIEKWEEQGMAAGQVHSYSLPNGLVETTVRASTAEVIEVRSAGYVSPHFKDRLLVVYDLSAKKILDWNRLR